MPSSDLDPSNGEAVAARVKALLENGPLAEAEEICKQALGRFPQSDELQTLAADIREKETAVRHLLERGEDYLSEGNLNVAGELFDGACHLLPQDRELSAYVVSLFHQRAQAVLEADWRSAEASLAMADRIQPGYLVPPALASALEEKKQKAAAESRLEPPSVLVPRPTRPWLRPVVALVAFAAVVMAAFFIWMNHLVRLTEPAKAPLEIAAAGEPETGTLTVQSNVSDTEVFVNEQEYKDPSQAGPLQIQLPPGTYQLRATRPGYADFGPVTATVTKGGELTLNLPVDPKPALLTIRGAAPGVEVKIDGVVLGAVAASSGLTNRLPPGRHWIELSRPGYVSKKIALQLEPGQVALLNGANVELQSTDASQRSPSAAAVPLPPP
jgi:tetratricopeptide (TPR) repeat protein